MSLDLYQTLTDDQVPSDQKWLESTEVLEKMLSGMLGANFLAASTTADATLRELRDCVECGGEYVGFRFII